MPHRAPAVNSAAKCVKGVTSSPRHASHPQPLRTGTPRDSSISRQHLARSPHSMCGGAFSGRNGVSPRLPSTADTRRGTGPDACFPGVTAPGPSASTSRSATSHHPSHFCHHKLQVQYTFIWDYGAQTLSVQSTAGEFCALVPAAQHRIAKSPARHPRARERHVAPVRIFFSPSGPLLSPKIEHRSEGEGFRPCAGRRGVWGVRWPGGLHHTPDGPLLSAHPPLLFFLGFILLFFLPCVIAIFLFIHVVVAWFKD